MTWVGSKEESSQRKEPTIRGNGKPLFVLEQKGGQKGSGQEAKKVSLRRG